MRPAFRSVLAILLVLVLAGCTGEGDRAPGSPSGGRVIPTPTVSATAPQGRAFSGNGVSFVYPGRWEELEMTETSASAGRQLWDEAVGIDDVNFVWVAGYERDGAITSDNVQEHADRIGREIGAPFAQAGGDLVSGPEIADLAGLPALSFVGSAVNPSGATVVNRLVVAFDGTTEYFVNCQYDDTGERAIVRGCERILSTFDVPG